MTVIGSSIHITGDVSGNEDVTIHGRLTGHLDLPDHALLIARGARVDAEVRGARVTVLGELRGSATATDRIELGPSSVAKASLSATHVVLADGSRFNGHIDMGQRTIAVRLASYRATRSA